MKPDRFTAIRQLLFARGQMSIADIAAAVQASEPTVRRDLTLLAIDAGRAIIRIAGSGRPIHQEPTSIRDRCPVGGVVITHNLSGNHVIDAAQKALQNVTHNTS